MNKIEFEEMKNEFGLDVYEFEKFMKLGFILEACFITKFNKYLKEINRLTLENTLIRNAIDKLNKESREEADKYIIEERKRSTDEIVRLIARDEYYKKVSTYGEPFIKGEEDSKLEDAFKDYCLKEHPAVKAIVSKAEEELYEYVKRNYYQNDIVSYSKMIENNQKLFTTSIIEEDKYNQISTHYFKLRQSINIETNKRKNNYPYTKKEMFLDDLKVAEEEAELRIQLKKIKDANEALHKDFVSLFTNDIKL